MRRKFLNLVRIYFGFSRGETNGVIILIPLLFIILFTEPVYNYFHYPTRPDFASESKKLDSLVSTLHWDSATQKKHSDPPKLFPFNPNTLSKEGWVRLGFSPTLSSRIIHFREKGGKFIVRKDIFKIHGIDSSFATTLLVWLQLPDTIKTKGNTKYSFPKKSTQHSKADINTADTVQLIALFGIGPKLSARIIKYRTRLGGFVAMDQLKEVYGLDTTVIYEIDKNFFIREGFRPSQLDINKTQEKELVKHPYITYALAKVWTAYRFQHGDFQSLDDLNKIPLMDSMLYQKIKPYLSLNH